MHNNKEISYTFSMLRGALRRAWMKSKVRIIALQSWREKKDMGRSSPQWAIKCDNCGVWHKQSDIDVDHKIPAGSLKGPDDIKDFVLRLLFVGVEDLRPLCKVCHKVITHMFDKNMTWEEAVLDKKRIAFGKLKKAPMQKMLRDLSLSDEGTKPQMITRYMDYLKST